MWKGVTEFLENVDKTAAVNLSGVSEDNTRAVGGVDGLDTSGHIHDGFRRPSTHGSRPEEGDDSISFDDDDDDEGQHQPRTPTSASASASSTPATRAPPTLSAPTLPPKVHQQPTPTSRLPAPPGRHTAPSSDVSIESLQEQIRRLVLDKEQRDAAHESSSRDRDRRYLALEADYDAVTARGRGLDVELQHRADEITSLQSEVERLKSETQVSASAGESGSLERARLAEDLRRSEAAQRELSDQLDEISGKVAGLERGKSRAEESLLAANAALSQYKTQTKMLLDTKSKRVAELEAALSEAATKGGDAPAHTDTAASAEELLQRPDVSALVASMIEKREAAAREEADKRAQQTSADLKAAQSTLAEMGDTVRSLQLHNEQLQEMYDDEKRGAEAAAQRFQISLTKHEQEVYELRKANHVGVSTPNAEKGLEAKVQEMATLIMQKQQALEDKRAEADQWRTRFEVSSQRLREAEMVSNAVKLRSADEPRRGGYATDYGNAEEGRPSSAFRETALFSNIASRGRWGKKVAGAAERIDGFSLTTGSYLRRNSTLRIALLVYIVVLQLYVFIVVSVNSVVQTGSVHEVNNNLLPNGQPIA